MATARTARPWDEVKARWSEKEKVGIAAEEGSASEGE